MSDKHTTDSHALLLKQLLMRMIILVWGWENFGGKGSYLIQLLVKTISGQQLQAGEPNGHLVAAAMWHRA